jgi:hypothetical protein
MSVPMKPPPRPIVHEQPGSTVWVSRYRRPMDGSPELITHDGFTHELDARAFKAMLQASRCDTDCVCLTFERPAGAKPPKKPKAAGGKGGRE